MRADPRYMALCGLMPQAPDSPAVWRQSAPGVAADCAGRKLAGCNV